MATDWTRPTWSKRISKGALRPPFNEKLETYFWSVSADARGWTSSICTPQQISECGLPSVQIQGFSYTS